MGDDDAEARRKRAEALRGQISELKGERRPKASAPEEEDHQPERRDAPAIGPTPGEPPRQDGRRDAPRVHSPSPRDFIEQRMRELDRKGEADKD